MSTLISQVGPIPMGAALSTPNSSAQVEKGTKFAFQCFLLFGAIVFVAPQALIPAVAALGIGKIVMALALFSYVKFAYSQGRLNFVEGKEIKILAWFFLLALASVLYSKWPGGSFQFFMESGWKVGVVFLLGANLLTSVARAQQLCWSFVLFAGVNSFIGLNNWHSGTLMAGATNRIEGFSIAPLASNVNDLGLLLNMFIPLVWYAYRSAKTAVARYAALLTLFSCAATVVITFSRGAFLGLLAVLSILVWKQAEGKRIRTMLLIAVLAPVIVALLPAGYSDRMVSIVEGEKDETGSRGHRIELMGSAVVSMIEHPFGIGLGMNNLNSAEAGLGWNVVHNAYLQVGVELGMVGFVLYLYFIWKTYAGLKPIERSVLQGFSELAFAIRLSLIAYLVGAMFGAVAFNWYFFYPGGMAVALKTMVKQESSPLPEMEARAV